MDSYDVNRDKAQIVYQFGYELIANEINHFENSRTNKIEWICKICNEI